MGLANTVPVFLDSASGYNEDQVRMINILVRTARRSFESKARQTQEDPPVVSKFFSSSYNRVISLKDYLYNGYFTASFIINPSGFEKDGQYPLFETEQAPTYFYVEGSNSDSKPASFLTSLGHVTVRQVSEKYLWNFVVDTDDWPEDSNGNKVQYSVFITGRV